MKRIIAILLTIPMVLSICACAKEEAPLTQTEIHELTEESAEIRTLSEIDVMSGRDTGMELRDNLTRAEAVTLIERLVKPALIEIAREDVLEDIAGHWAETTIASFYNAGLVNAASGAEFRPDDSIRYLEFVQILLTAMGYEVPTMGLAGRTADEVVIASGLVSDGSLEEMASDNVTLTRDDAAKICYAALLAKCSDGSFLCERHAGAESLLPIEDGIGFADRLNNAIERDDNIMFSPFSLKMAIMMAANGASGETRTEILNVLGTDSLDAFNEKAENMIKAYSENKAFRLNAANSVWIKNDCRFTEGFLNAVKRFYNADAETVTDETAVKKINSWVNEKTEGKIPEIIKNADFTAALINAVYFNAAWQNEFSEGMTEKKIFNSKDGSTKEIDFMNQTDYFDIAVTDDYSIIELPYTRYVETPDGGEKSTVDASMYLIMGEYENPAAEIENASLKTERVSLSMPKFTFESEMDLTSVLSAMGVEKLFSDEAELENMIASYDMKIQEVLQKTYISVDEKGTEAAAVTMAAAGATAMPPEPVELTFDKPFTFVIKDKTNDEILFMGEYAYAK